MKLFGALFFIMLNIQQHVYWGIFTLEQDGQKSGGAMPPSLKSGGATGPPGPPPPVPPPMDKH